MDVCVSVCVCVSAEQDLVVVFVCVSQWTQQQVVLCSSVAVRFFFSLCSLNDLISSAGLKPRGSDRKWD